MYKMELDDIHTPGKTERDSLIAGVAELMKSDSQSAKNNELYSHSFWRYHPTRIVKLHNFAEYIGKNPNGMILLLCFLDAFYRPRGFFFDENRTYYIVYNSEEPIYSEEANVVCKRINIFYKVVSSVYDIPPFDPEVCLDKSVLYDNFSTYREMLCGFRFPSIEEFAKQFNIELGDDWKKKGANENKEFRTITQAIKDICPLDVESIAREYVIGNEKMHDAVFTMQILYAACGLISFSLRDMFPNLQLTYK